MNKLLFKNIFDYAFGIRAEEFKIVNLFLLYLTILYTGYTVISTAALSLFLGRVNSATLHQLLPWLYIAIAVVVTVIAKVYQTFIDRFSRIKLIIWTTAFFIFSFFILRLLVVYQPQTWIYALLMVWDETSCVILIMVFYSFLGDYFQVHSARRLYAYITGGMALGAPIGGFGSAFLLNYVSTPNLIFIGITLHAAALLFAYSIYQENLPIKERIHEKKIKTPLVSKKLIYSKYLWLVFLVGAFPIVCACLDSYQMFYVASKTLPEKELGSFMGKFYGSAGLMLLVIDFLLAKWFRNRSVFTNLLMMPILLAFTCIAFLINPILIYAASIKFVDNVLTNTVNTFAFQVLFLPLSERVRMHAQSMSAGLMSSGAKILGGATLVGLSYLYLPIQIYTIIILVISIFWISCVFLLKPLYKKELAASIAKINLKSIDFETLINHHRSNEIIKEILNSNDEKSIVTLLRSLNPKIFSNNKKIIDQLMVHPNPVIATEAFNTYGLYGNFYKEDTTLKISKKQEKESVDFLAQHFLSNQLFIGQPLKEVSLNTTDFGNKVFNKVLVLRQAYQEMGALPKLTKQIFIDIIYFYTGTLLALLSLEFHTPEIFQIKDLIFQSDEKIIHTYLELLETVIGPKKANQLKKILTPINKLSFTANKPSKETIEKLLILDPWVNLLTLNILQGPDHMKPTNQVYLDYIQTVLFLKQVALFQEVPINFLVPIAEAIYEQHHSDGDCIFKEGENTHSLFIIKSGSVKIQAKNKEIVLLSTGESFGELSILENLPHSADAYAAEKTSLFRLDENEFIKILDIYPEVSKALLKILARRLRVIAT